MNAVVQHQSVMNSLIPRSMNEAIQLAELMARGKMMPEHLRNPGDALMVIEQAIRWQMSPYAVAQATFSIKGKLLFAGTLVAAAIEHSGAIVGLIDYQFSGEGMNRKVVVSATRKGEAAAKTVEVVLKDAQTANEQWKKQPDQMLTYHGARVWARRWTPGVMLGVYTPDEMEGNAPTDTFAGTTIDAKPEPPMQTAPPTPDTPVSRLDITDPEKWLDALTMDLANAQTGEEVDAILAAPDVQNATDKARGALKDRLNHVVNEAIARTAQTETSAPNDLFADEPPAEVETLAPPPQTNRQLADELLALIAACDTLAGLDAMAKDLSVIEKTKRLWAADKAIYAEVPTAAKARRSDLAAKVASSLP